MSTERSAISLWYEAHRAYFASVYEREEEPFLEHDWLCMFQDLPLPNTACVGCMLVQMRSDAQYEREPLKSLAFVALEELAEVALGHLEDVEPEAVSRVVVSS